MLGLNVQTGIIPSQNIDFTLYSTTQQQQQQQQQRRYHKHRQSKSAVTC